MAVAHIDVFRRDPQRFWSFYGERFATLRDKRAQPGPRTRWSSSSAAATSTRVVTQNIDMLHRRAGTQELVEVHGSIATCSCWECRAARGAGGGARRASPPTAERRAAL